MVLKINPLKYSCPFCGKKLESRFSKCFNIYCQGQKFNLGNLVIYRLNPNIGIGRVIKRLEIPTSKSLDEDDTQIITKYKVSFRNNIFKIIHPIDLIHCIFQEEDKLVCQILEEPLQKPEMISHKKPSHCVDGINVKYIVVNF